MKTDSVSATETTPVELRVAGKTEVADGVVALTLQDPHGRRLPDWAPGAHVDLMLPSGPTRQYSLCGDRWDAFTYRVGVLRESSGRGGSMFVHDELAVGDTVGLGGPRNNFALAPSPRYQFIAGGIGITPLLPMIRQAEILGADWHLLYGGRSRTSMAFRDELTAHGEKVTVVPQDECGMLDLAPWLPEARADTKVYCCGPGPLLAAVDELCTGWPAGLLRTERFTATEHTPVRETAFEVELRRSGLSLTVPPEQSVLQAMNAAGINLLSSCRRGLCGTCETTVLEGEPDHRDSLLDDAERAEGECMFPCVSRSCGDRLVLDL